MLGGGQGDGEDGQKVQTSFTRKKLQGYNV